MRRPAPWLFLALTLSLAAVSGGSPLAADQPSVQESPAPTPAAPVATTPGDTRLDVAAATDAYLAKVPPDKKARSDAYFEGGYWLILWDFLCGVAIFWLVLQMGWSAAMRDRADRITGRLPRFLGWLRTPIYWAQLLAVCAVLQFPLTVYEGFFREHKYGLATQTFGPWFGDYLKMLAVNLIMYSILFIVLYAVLRRLRNWWLWGGFVSIVFIIFVVVFAPVYVFPLFNTFTKLEDPAIREPILSLARANGISVEDVYVMDASRQTTRVSANVSGVLGTTRITLNDNLLKRASLPEIEAVMGHEMGHFVLHHNYKGVAFLGFVSFLGFVFLSFSYAWAERRFGSRWRVSGIGDVAGLPLLAILFSVYGFVMTPVINSYTRIEEAEADLFGLNATRQADGAAEIALKLGEYRKLEPGPLEEILMFDHPSGRSRITMAMRWKAENMGSAGGAAAPLSP